MSPEDPDGTELSLEPDEHPAARPFKQALVEDGIPFTSFAVDDVAAEYERLVGRGVRFTQPPTDMGTGDDGGVRRHVRQPHPDRSREQLNRGSAPNPPPSECLLPGFPQQALGRQERSDRGAGGAYLASLEGLPVTMAKISVRPVWVGLIDFQERLPGPLGGVSS